MTKKILRMQDRFKFRVWDKKEGKMYDDLSDCPMDVEISWVNQIFKEYLISNIAGYDVKHGKARNVEVIGNIYENPELLEDKGC